jgi:hypothetical protein
MQQQGNADSLPQRRSKQLVQGWATQYFKWLPAGVPAEERFGPGHFLVDGLLVRELLVSNPHEDVECRLQFCVVELFRLEVAVHIATAGDRVGANRCRPVPVAMADRRFRQRCKRPRRRARVAWIASAIWQRQRSPRDLGEQLYLTEAPGVVTEVPVGVLPLHNHARPPYRCPSALIHPPSARSPAKAERSPCPR